MWRKAALKVLKGLISDYEYSREYRKTGLVRKDTPSAEGKRLVEDGKVGVIAVNSGSVEISVEGNHGVHRVLVSTDPKDPWLRLTIAEPKGEKAFVVTARTENYKPTKVEWAAYHFLLRELKSASSEESEDPASRVASLLENVGSLLIIGPTGCGKTHSLRKASEMIGWELVEIAGSEGLSDSDLLGSFVPRIRGDGFLFLPGLLTRAFKKAASGERVVFYLDELNRLSPKSQNLFVQVLNPKDGGYVLYNYLNQREYIAPSENIRFVSAINIGSGYSGTSQVDIALMRRFESVLFMDYLPPAVEAKVVSDASGLDLPLCERLVRVANSVRESYRRMELKAPLDTGSLISWARLLADSFDFTLDEVLLTADESWVHKVVTYDPTGFPTSESLQAVREYIKAVFGE